MDPDSVDRPYLHRFRIVSCRIGVFPASRGHADRESSKESQEKPTILRCRVVRSVHLGVRWCHGLCVGDASDADYGCQ